MSRKSSEIGEFPYTYTLPETEDVSWRPRSLEKTMASFEKSLFFVFFERKYGLDD